LDGGNKQPHQNSDNRQITIKSSTKVKPSGDVSSMILAMTVLSFENAKTNRIKKLKLGQPERIAGQPVWTIVYLSRNARFATGRSSKRDDHTSSLNT